MDDAGDHRARRRSEVPHRPCNYPPSPSSPGDEEISQLAPRARPNGAGQRDGYAAGEESNGYAGYDLDHERRPSRFRSPAWRRSTRDPARLSVAGGISGAPGAGADHPQNRETHLEGNLTMCPAPTKPPSLCPATRMVTAAKSRAGRLHLDLCTPRPAELSAR